MNRFDIGQMGEIGRYKYRALACVTYGNEDGEWDEWCLELHDGSIGWLEEEDGQISLTRKFWLTEAVPAYDNVRIGQTLPINRKQFFVVEKCSARVMQIAGLLPFELAIGESMSFIDGIIDGNPASLEYNDEGVELVIGEVLDLRSTPEAGTV